VPCGHTTAFPPFANTLLGSVVPIGRYLEISAGVINDDLRDAVAMIEAVHGVEKLPRIPLYGTRFPVVAGETRFRRGRFSFTAEGDAVSIAVEIAQEHRLLSTLHEVGHFLDLAGIGPARRFESTVVEHGELAGWRSAVAETEAVRGLIEVAETGRAWVAAEAQDQLEWRELWARSYAQYIVERGESVDLARSLEAFRPSASRPVYLPVHWHDDDFAAIGHAIDEVFGRLGWLKK
jgi:hypothetical protein